MPFDIQPGEGQEKSKNTILETILGFYFVWGMVLAVALKVIDVKRSYFALSGMAAVFAALVFISHKKLHLREFIIRYWKVTLVAFLCLLYQWVYLGHSTRSVLRGITIYLLIYTGFLYEKRFRSYIGKAFRVSSILLGVTSVIGIIWWTRGIYPIEKISAEAAKYFYSAPQRMDSVFVHPIPAACFMLLLVSLALFAWKGDLKIEVARFLLLFLGIAGLYATFTRSAYLVLVMIPVVWAIGKWNERRAENIKQHIDEQSKQGISKDAQVSEAAESPKKLGLLPKVLIVIGAVALVSVMLHITGVAGTIYNRFFETNWREDPSYTFRMDTFSITTKSILGRGIGRFLFGMGAGKGNSVLYDVKWFTDKYEVIHGIDNSYSTMFLEQGIFAFVLYLFEFLYVLKRCFVPMHDAKEKSEKTHAVGRNSLYYILLPQLVMAITFDAQNWPGTEFVIFVLIGIEMAGRTYPHPGFSKEHPLIINGRIFAQNVTGVQRYGIEIIKQIDTMVEPGEVILALPQGGLVTQPNFHNIKTEVVGKGNGNKWTQVYLPIYAYKKRGVLLGLAGIAPVIKPDYIATHDISFMRYPDSYGKSFRLMYRIGYLLTLYRCKGIITISEFSRDELRTFYDLDESRFTIAGNSAEHLFEGVAEQDKARTGEILSKWNLTTETKYFLSVGSKNLHKNQIYIKKLAKKYPDKTFVIAGGSSARSFGGSGDAVDGTGTSKEDGIHNIILTGYITDEELRTLYANAHAFVFPSLYEGFGIPPMEAILSGVKRIALADIPVLREIYTKGCYFFDPRNEDAFNMEALENGKETITDAIRDYYRETFSWSNSARNILGAIRCSFQK
ncbi:MAG: glycosyltransferase [Butyrivibrio sp.]|nr:glycosyltransferase [Butyrivibrio sp.]